MKKFSIIILTVYLAALCACTSPTQTPQIAATTLPVYHFTSEICKGTNITVGRLVTESVSCLHDYSLQVGQMQMLESAQIVVISGGGLEDFFGNVLAEKKTIDASANIHVHQAIGDHDYDHGHDIDPHFWLSPECAKIMAENIYQGLCSAYPQLEAEFKHNYNLLLDELNELQIYGENTLQNLSCGEIITFHDGFGYLAESYNITIIASVEEESGSETSAAQIIHLATLIEDHHLPAVFTERNGSTSCANILSAETGVKIYTLDMAMTGSSYFDAMYHNIDTLKEALS